MKRFANVLAIVVAICAMTVLLSACGGDKNKNKNKGKEEVVIPDLVLTSWNLRVAPTTTSPGVATWTYQEHAVGYELYLETAELEEVDGGDGVQVGQNYYEYTFVTSVVVNGGATTSYDFANITSNLNPGTAYYVRIRALGGDKYNSSSFTVLPSNMLDANLRYTHYTVVANTESVMNLSVADTGVVTWVNSNSNASNDTIYTVKAVPANIITEDIGIDETFAKSIKGLTFNTTTQYGFDETSGCHSEQEGGESLERAMLDEGDYKFAVAISHRIDTTENKFYKGSSYTVGAQTFTVAKMAEPSITSLSVSTGITFGRGVTEETKFSIVIRQNDLEPEVNAEVWVSNDNPTRTTDSENNVVIAISQANSSDGYSPTTVTLAAGTSYMIILDAVPSLVAGGNAGHVFKILSGFTNGMSVTFPALAAVA